MVVPGNRGSNSFTINAEDIKKLGKGMMIAVAGAALTYGTTWLADTDFGMWTPVIVAGWSITVNFVRRFIADNTV